MADKEVAKGNEISFELGNISVISKKLLTSFVFKSFLSGFLIRVRVEVRLGFGDGFRVRVWASVRAREGWVSSITAGICSN